MQPISYKRHRFPPEVIRYTVWLYFRFTLSLRDVEDLLAERGIEVSYETVRCWTQKFGRQFARNLRRSRPRPTATWHLDEMVVRISGRRMFLWRAVDSEGEVLDMLVQRRRNKVAALRLLRKLLRRHGIRPEAIVTDGLSSYRSAANTMGLERRHRPGKLRGNNRAENSHQPVRRRKRVMKRFKAPGSAQQFLATHAAVYNAFNIQRHLLSRRSMRRLRNDAMSTWAAASIAP
jgi:transposase-like protein